MTVLVLSSNTVDRTYRTPAQVLRRERNLMIGLASKGGASTRSIARTFKLGQSRVVQILADLREEHRIIDRRKDRIASLCRPSRKPLR